MFLSTTFYFKIRNVYSKYTSKEREQEEKGEEGRKEWEDRQKDTLTSPQIFPGWQRMSLPLCRRDQAEVSPGAEPHTEFLEQL